MCELCEWLKKRKKETRGPQQPTKSGKDKRKKERKKKNQKQREKMREEEAR